MLRNTGLTLLLPLLLALSAPAHLGAEEEKTGGDAAAVKTGLELLDPGAEPQMPVRYKLSAGLRQTIEMVIAVSGSFSTQMGAQHFTFPPVKLTLKLETKESGAADSVAFAFKVAAGEVIEDEGATPGLVDMTKETAVKAVGLTGSGTVSNRGIVSGLEIVHPEGLGRDAMGLVDILKQQFHQFMVPLPETAIGMGAEWKVTAPAKAAGFSFLNATTYRLTVLDGEQGKVEVSVSNTAEEQAVKLPLLPGVPTLMKDLDSEGSGGMSFLLSRPVADSRTDTELTMELEIGSDEQVMPATAELKIRVNVTPTEAQEATPK